MPNDHSPMSALTNPTVARGMAVPVAPPRRARAATIFGYARVSTAEQTTALQTDALRAAGAVEIVTDDATSGTTPARDRAGFSGLWDMLQPGDTVVIYALSRLGRSTLDVLSTVQALDARGVALVSVTEKLDTSSPMGRAMLTIMAAIAQLERDMLSERTRDGIAAARARGAKPGRPRLDSRQAEQWLREGYPVHEVVMATGLSESTVRRIQKRLATVSVA